MQALVSFIAPVIIFVSTLISGSQPPSAQGPVSQVSSVELGLHETSPKGAEGGFAMPASGCSDTSHGPIHDCATIPTISVDKPIVRLGDSVTVTWNPHGHTNCSLSINLSSKTPAPNANATGSLVDSPTGETSYSIVCDGAGNQASVTVRVLPRIQET